MEYSRIPTAIVALLVTSVALVPLASAADPLPDSPTELLFPPCRQVEGTVTDGSQPVEGIAVVALPVTANTNALVQGYANNVTDEDGRYTFDLRPGEWRIVAYDTATPPAYLPNATGPVAVACGPAVQQHDIGLQGVDVTATGSVSVAVQEVLDASGPTTEPVAGEEVTLGLPNGGLCIPVQSPQTTNASGQATFAPVPLATYCVQLDVDGYQQASQNVTITDNQPDASVGLTTIRTPQAVTGTVTDTDAGTAVDGLEVTATHPVFCPGGTPSHTSFSCSAVTASDGSFHLALPWNATDYDIEAGSDAADVRYTSKTASVNVPRQPQAAPTQDFNLSRTVSKLSGTVEDADATGNPALPGATVNVTGNATGATFEVTTGALGDFSGTLPWDEYSVDVSLTDYVNASVSVEVEPATDNSTVVQLVRGTGTVSGTVTDAFSGAALDGADVTLSSSEIAATPSDTTGADGGFEITAPFGSYDLEASQAKYVTGSASVTVSDGSSTTEDLALRRVKGTLEGTVTSGGSAADGAEVCLGFSGGSFCAITDGSGAYQIRGPWGSYDAEVSHGSKVLTTTADIMAGTTTTKDFNLDNLNGTVVGAVTDLDAGTALEGATVEFSNGSGVVADTTTASDGSFSQSLAPGTYSVEIKATNYTAGTVPDVEVETGVENDLGTQSLARSTVTVTGTVVDADAGAPLADAELNLTGDATGSVVASSAADGTFSIDVPWDTYELNATKADYDDNVTALGALAPDTVDVGDVLLDRVTGKLVIKAWDQDAQSPVDGADVALTGDATGTQAATANATGDATLTVPWDEYNVTVSATDYDANETADVPVAPGATVTIDPYNLTRVTGSILGVVVDDSHTACATACPGIEGATVTLTGTTTGARTVQTNATGGFDVDLPWDGYTVNVTADGYDFVAEASVALAAGANEDTGTWSLVRLTGTVAGTVVESLGNETAPEGTAANPADPPVTDATITVTCTGQDTGSWTDTTDANGNYSIVMPFDTGVVCTTSDAGDVFYPTTSDAFDLADNATEDPGLVVERRIWTITGTVETATGDPLEAVVNPVRVPTEPDAPSPTTSDPNTGAYSIDVIYIPQPDGPRTNEVALTATNDDYHPAINATLIGPDSGSTQVQANFDLVPRGLSVRWPLNVDVQESLSGARSIAGATVDVTNVANGTQVASCTTGANGTCNVRVESGIYEVKANATDYQPNATGPVVVPAQGAATVELDRGLVTIDATVDDGTNAVQGAKVSATGPNATGTCETDVNGECSIQVIWDPVAYVLNASHPSFGAPVCDALPVLDSAGASAAATCSLTVVPPPSDLTGQVNLTVEGQSRGLAGADVTLYDCSGNCTPVDSTTAGADGSFAFPGVDASSYQACATHLGGLWGNQTHCTANTTAPAGATVDLGKIDFVPLVAGACQPDVTAGVPPTVPDQQVQLSPQVCSTTTSDGSIQLVSLNATIDGKTTPVQGSWALQAPTIGAPVQHNVSSSEAVVMNGADPDDGTWTVTFHPDPYTGLERAVNVTALIDVGGTKVELHTAMTQLTVVGGNTIFPDLVWTINVHNQASVSCLPSVVATCDAGTTGVSQTEAQGARLFQAAK